MKAKYTKKMVGLRIPSELNKKIDDYVKKIGISRQAFILRLIYDEMQRINNSTTPKD